MKHALSGVEKGRRAGTAPIEIMGLMVGKADGDTLVVMDACPLPVEGSETRVVADDAQVYMTKMMESLELVCCPACHACPCIQRRDWTAGMLRGLCAAACMCVVWLACSAAKRAS